MTVLVDARPLVDPHGGGVTRVARGLMSALIETLPETKFVLATTGLHNSTLTIPNKLWSFLCFAGITSFDRAFAKHKPDLLFLPNLGFVGKPKIPYLLVVHDISFLIEPAWFSRKARWWHKAVRAKELIRGARQLFAVSERTKQDLIEYLNIPSDRITVIPMGLNTFDLSTLTKPPISGRYLLCLGGGDPRKNSGCALTAYQILKNDPQFTDVKLVTLGKSNRPDDQELSALYQHATAFLYPSWYEGFGLPLHEAARFNTPCIASTAGALPETAPMGTLFAPPSKPHLWAEAIATVLQNPQTFKTKTSLGDWQPAADIVRKFL